MLNMPLLFCKKTALCESVMLLMTKIHPYLSCVLIVYRIYSILIVILSYYPVFAVSTYTETMCKLPQLL